MHTVILLTCGALVGASGAVLAIACCQAAGRADECERESDKEFVDADVMDLVRRNQTARRELSELMDRL